MKTTEETNNEENGKRRFEIKKILIAGLIGFIATGIWKFVDWKKENALSANTSTTAEKLYQFVLTVNPQNGNARKTLNFEIYPDMTGLVKGDNMEYKVKGIVFQSKDVLKFVLNGSNNTLELNGFYDKAKDMYAGITLGDKEIDGYTIESWEAQLK